MCYRYAVLNDFKLMATSVRKWSKHLTEFPIVRFVTHDWQTLCRSIHTSIRHLTATYHRIAVEQALQDIKPSFGDQIHHNFSAVDSIKEEIDPQMNEASGYTPTVSDRDMRFPVVVTPRRSSSRESPWLWIYHAGCQQWICPWIPRLSIRHAGHITSTTVHWQ